jgi:uncharacterized membrane protein YeaQ/YmgE (transglycosylase-associated protein family)
MESLIISLVSGAVGGNVAGAVFKRFNLGLLGNSLAGIVGGGVGGQLLGMLGAGGLDGIVGAVASGGVGGAVVLAVVGAIKSVLAK